MKAKLDELEDLVAEMKQKDNVHGVVQKEQLVEKLEKDIARLQGENAELLLKLKS